MKTIAVIKKAPEAAIRTIEIIVFVSVFVLSKELTDEDVRLAVTSLLETLAKLFALDVLLLVMLEEELLVVVVLLVLLMLLLLLLTLLMLLLLLLLLLLVVLLLEV